MTEIWKSIPDAPAYEVSCLGHVRRVVRGKTQPKARQIPYCLKLAPDSTGRLQVTLIAPDGRRLQKLVHRLAAEAFLGPQPTPDHEVCHNDGNHLNNVVDNLRWDTPKGNAADRFRHGTQLLGEAVPTAKLTADQVRAIRACLAAAPPGTRKSALAQLASLHGVSQSTIKAIATRQNWAWIA